MSARFLRLDSAVFKFLCAFAVSVMMLLPSIWAYLNVPIGYSFVGINTFANFHDVTGVYFSAIQQSLAGALEYTNPFSLESTKFFHYPVYFGMGKFGRIFDLPIEFVYLFFSFVLAFIFSLFLFRFIKVFFLDKKYIFFAFVLCNFGSLFSMAVPESSAFFSLTFPHFVVSLFALFSAIYCLIYYFYYKKNYYLVGVLLSVMVLSIIHPWMCIPLGVAYLLWIALSTSRGKCTFRDFVPFLVISIVSLPMFLYYRSNISWTSFSLENEAYLFPVLYGGILFFTALGLWQSRKIKRDNPLFFLILWFIVEVVFCYLPLPFSRRFYEGLFMPVSVFAIVGIDYLLKKKLFDAWVAYLVVPFFLCAGVIGSYFFHFVWLPNLYVYRNSNEFAAAEYLNSISDFDHRILSVATSSNFLAGRVNSSFYVGHGIQTPNFKEKNRNSRNYFLGQMNVGEREHLVVSEHICYVFFGGDEMRPGGINLDNEKYLEKVFIQADVSVYKYKLCD